MKQNEPILVFISYSHKDRDAWKVDTQELVSWLDRHLKPLNAISWFDPHLNVGDEWEQVIYAKIQESSLFILLLSDDFFSSEFITQKELPWILKRCMEDQLEIVAVVAGRLRGIPKRYEGIVPRRPDPTRQLPLFALDPLHPEWAKVSRRFLTQTLAAVRRIQTRKQEGLLLVLAALASSSLLVIYFGTPLLDHLQNGTRHGQVLDVVSAAILVFSTVMHIVIAFDMIHDSVRIGTSPLRLTAGGLSILTLTVFGFLLLGRFWL